MSKCYDWNVSIQGVPTIIRRCSKCGKKMDFECSNRFRVNANNKRLDVWLIYRCIKCKTSWNMEIYQRISPYEIPSIEYEKFLQNDCEFAKKYALDFNYLKANNVQLNYNCVSLEISGEEIIDKSEIAYIHITSETDFMYRIDKLLSEKLGVSRRVIQAMIEMKHIKIHNKEDDDLLKPINIKDLQIDIDWN